MLRNLFTRMFRGTAAAPAPTPAPAPAPAPATAHAPEPRKDRRKLKRGKRRGSPGARRIDPNGPWLDQAKGGRDGR